MKIILLITTVNVLSDKIINKIIEVYEKNN